MESNPKDATTPEPYKARDPSFFALAAGAFAAALHPDTLAESDADKADDIGDTCARVLDRGIVPKGFLMPRTRRVLDLVHRQDLLKSGETDRPLAGVRHPVIMTEGEKAKERELLAKAGPIPTRDELMATNERQIAALADLSEPVRFSALLQACIRIDARPQITGARADEAVAIVVEEVERALRKHKAVGNPLHDLENPNAPPIEDPSRVVPYPVNVMMELLRAGAAGAAGAAAEADDAGEPPPAPAAEGQAAP